MINTIMRAIDLSAIAYQPPADIATWLHGRAEGFKWFKNENIQAFSCEDDVATWVIIRGTEVSELKDWATDLDCGFIQGPYGQVHRGFYTAAMDIFWDVSDLLLPNVVSNKRVIFSGHSLGAAVANQLFSIRCKQFPTADAMSIPIAPPRSMSGTASDLFGSLYGDKVFPVVNNNDVVTRVPTRIMGYSHILNEKLQYLDEGGNLHHSLSWWEKFLDRVKGAAFDFGEPGIDGLKDHSVTEYQRIWGNLPGITAGR